MLRPTPNAKVVANPRVGSSHNPVSAAPRTVPSVFTAKTRPTERPVREISAVATRDTNGRVIPRQTAGPNMTRKHSTPWKTS